MYHFIYSGLYDICYNLVKVGLVLEHLFVLLVSCRDPHIYVNAAVAASVERLIR